MKQKINRLTFGRTLLALTLLLASGYSNALTKGCYYLEDSKDSDTRFTQAILNNGLDLHVSGDRLTDGIENTLVLGEIMADKQVFFYCGGGAFGDPGDIWEGYTGNPELVPGEINIYKTEIPGLGLWAAFVNNPNSDFEAKNGLRKYRLVNGSPGEGTYAPQTRMKIAVHVYDVNKLPSPGLYAINLSPFSAKMIYGIMNPSGTEGHNTVSAARFEAGVVPLRIFADSCELLTDNIQVDLGEISSAEIRPVSPKLANFNIELANCPRDVKVDYKFVRNNVAPLDSSILMLEKEHGSAEGVGIQISHNNNDGIFSPLHLNHDPGPGITGYTVAAYAVPNWPEPFRNVIIPLKARYRRLHDNIPVTPGKVKATAHFEVHYH